MYMYTFQLDVHTLDGIQLGLKHSSVQSIEVLCMCMYMYVKCVMHVACECVFNMCVFTLYTGFI